MNDFIRDPELNRLVREINDAADRRAAARALDGGSAAADDSADAATAREALDVILEEMRRREASDLTLLSGVSPVFRVRGELVTWNHPALTDAAIRAMFAPHLNERLRTQLQSDGFADFSVASGDRRSRFRVNLHRQRGELAAAVRILPAAIPTIEALQLPPAVEELAAKANGLVLICGPTGSGKSTTLAALIGEINRRQAKKIITIDDPIEYEHTNAKSLIEQIEIGRDSSSFVTALRAALRQDPDVIQVGEMRDLETISTAVTAAETGHLILSTLHTSSAAQAIDRIIDVFAPEQQQQIRQQLALSLQAIVCQQLLPTRDGRGRVPATEIVIANDAVRNHIRKQKLQNLYSEITLGKRLGMVTMEESLANLVRSGKVSPEEARARANRPEELDTALRA